MTTEILQDLRFAGRLALTRPGFTLVAIITLALGIGANTAIFSVINAIVLRPLPYYDSERLFEIGRTFPGGSINAISPPKFVFLKENQRSFDAIAATQGLGTGANLSDESRAEYIAAIAVTSEFFSILGVNPARGRVFTPQEDSPQGERVAMLSDAFWRKRYAADESIVGRSILINNTPHTVIGILPGTFEYLEPRDVFVPMRVNPASRDGGNNWSVIGRLKSGMTEAQAAADVQSVWEQFKTAFPDRVMKNETFGVISWQRSLTQDIQPLLLILLGAVGFVLLIACANVANLQLARAATRQKEMAVRMALGANAWRLSRQLLVEGLALAVAGGIGGVILGYWGVKALVAVMPPGMLPRVNEVGLDYRVLGFALAIAAIAGVIFSLAPAMQTLRADLNEVFRQGGDRGRSGGMTSRMRSALVVAEIALALVLMIGAGLMLRTFANLQNVKPGFDARNVLTFDISPKGSRYDTSAKTADALHRIEERLKSLPGVQEVALTNKLPLDSQFNLPYRLARQTQVAGAAQFRMVSPDYFSVMRTSVNKGRSFNSGDSAGSQPVAIVNESFVRRNYRDTEPLGEMLCIGCDYGDPSMRSIVGVVGDTRQMSLSSDAPPIVFIPVDQASEAIAKMQQQSMTTFVLLTRESPLSLSASVQHEMQQFDPMMPIRNIRSMEEVVSGSIAPQRFNFLLLAAFAMIGLLLAAIGIYGVVSYAVAQRTREMGIRIALGASRRRVMALVLGEGLVLALLGVGIGVGASLVLTRLIKTFLFGVSANDPLTFVAIASLLTLVVLIACYFPARRAVKIDPMTALRYE